MAVGSDKPQAGAQGWVSCTSSARGTENLLLSMEELGVEARTHRPPPPMGRPRRVGNRYAKTGTRAGPGTERAILEAFKPGTAPPDNAAVIGMGGSDQQSVSPDAERAVRSGTGGLY